MRSHLSAHVRLYIHFKGKPIGTPDAGAFFRVIEQHKVVSMFTAPTAIRIIRAEVSNTKDTLKRVWWAKKGEGRGGEGEKSTKGKKSLSYSPLPFRRLPRGIIIFVHVADANPVVTSAN